MEFKLTDNPAYGTCLQGYFRASFLQLKNVLEEPNGETDEYKVSTEWILENEYGDIVTVYDYKSTKTYDSDLPSVEQFRKFNTYNWHIGAKEKNIAESFINWLTDKIK
jgi:hypothetical protein